MNIKTFQRIVIMLLLVFAISGSASATDRYKIDGNLSDWNVTPFFHWQPNSYSANYTVEDFNSNEHNYDSDGSPYGGEQYDIEALYFDADNPGPNAYFAVVTSWYDTKDLAIDINPNDGFDYEYGINLTKGSNYGNVYYKPEWTDPIYPSHMFARPYQIKNGTGTFMGKATLVQVTVAPDPYEVNKLYRPNYIIEGKIPRSYLGNPKQDDISKIHISMFCGNDRIEIGRFRWPAEIPEFPSLTFPAASVMGIFYIFNRKKKS